MAGNYPGFFGNPSPTGEEVTLFDEPQAQGSALPVTVAMSALQINGSRGTSYRNMLIGGDFSTNPWQRGTAFTGISNTPTYTADRFFAVGGASSSISVSRQTGVPDGSGMGASLRFGRAAANADLTPIQLGQVLETIDSIKIAGRQVVLSFWARAGVNLSTLGGFLGLSIVTGTGVDQSAASMVAGTWSGQSARQLQLAEPANLPSFSPNGGNNTNVNVGNKFTNVNGVAISTSFVRYQVTCTLPANATQVGVLFQYTPVGTAGANDYVELAGIQLERVSAEQPYHSLFERRMPSEERQLCQRYCYVLPERATVAAVQGNGMVSATNVETIGIPLPVTMRTAPAVSVVAGTFRLNIAGTLTAVGGGFAGGPAATQSPEMANVVAALAATAGQATQLVSGAATWGGSITCSAEL